MSLEDKRQTLLGIFHETKDVFLLKVRPSLASAADSCGTGIASCTGHRASPPQHGCFPTQEIEKLGSKRGVVLQSIKEVVQVGAGCCRSSGCCAGASKLTVCVRQPLGMSACRSPWSWLQGLVDDDLVHAEKIGVSNYHWQVLRAQRGGAARAWC